MDKKERGFIVLILSVIIVMVAADLIEDFSQGVSVWHLLIESMIALTALIGIFFLVRGSFVLKHLLAVEKKISVNLRIESEKWRSQSRKYLVGLSQEIDSQLMAWKLTESEKEVAFLLLKGLSLKEIAEIRETKEKTTRAQSMAIYSKSGLAGRSELSAFFLEDLLVPRDEIKLNSNETKENI